ncbi:MFS multidrug transporter-like protein [Bimuria novae-zelandiae CBS 107.79]|uniref:MFS multidrug transporter-like protein n=1 Tax=Bimuria novae-zelandiae CBS 107.79 TaxID=1447943 RepID=A0A6A5UTP0_9PLEO|nr:MFS multidrug transporter-like protein [Bimuria novae-zelandiae CBS 107.79]
MGLYEKQESHETSILAHSDPNPAHGTPTISLRNDSSSISLRPEVQIPKWRLVSLYVSICFGLFLGFLDTSIVATALYTIGAEFQSLSKVNWVALSYTLAYLGCTTIFASLSDVFGRRDTYAAASVLFLAFSLGCGWAQDLNQLIAFRTLQGVGGSGLYSIAFVILPEISSLKMLKMIGALAGGVIVMSGILGPVLGGVITNYSTWRWIFWINAPIGVGPLILFVLAWPDEKQLPPAERRPFRQLDFLGFFLLVVASVPLVFSFQEAGIRIVSNKHVWKTAMFLAPLLVGTVCWIALFGWEYIVSIRWSASINPLFPLRLAKNRIYTSAVAATMLSGFPYFVVIYSLPTHFQVVNNHSALASAIALLPMLGSAAVGATIAGAISSKKNNTFPVMMTGAVLMLIGTATLSTLDSVNHTQAKAYGLQVFVGLGFGLTVSTSSMIASVESEFRDNAVAQGIVAQVRVFGGSIGIATSTAILGIKQRQQLLGTGLLTPSQLQSLRDTMSSLAPDAIVAVKQAYTDAFDDVLVVCSIISGVCLLVTIGCWQRSPLSMPERREQQVENEANRQREIAEAKARSRSVEAVEGK